MQFVRAYSVLLYFLWGHLQILAWFNYEISYEKFKRKLQVLRKVFICLYVLEALKFQVILFVTIRSFSKSFSSTLAGGLDRNQLCTYDQQQKHYSFHFYFKIYLYFILLQYQKLKCMCLEIWNDRKTSILCGSPYLLHRVTELPFESWPNAILSLSDDPIQFLELKIWIIHQNIKMAIRHVGSYQCWTTSVGVMSMKIGY